MKKQAFLAIFLVTVFFANAQIYSIIFDPPADSIRGWYFSARVGAGGIPNGTSYVGHYIYEATGDTMFHPGPNVNDTAGVIKYESLYGLGPDTTYQVAWVSRYGLSYDTSAYISIATPQVLPIVFSNITVTPGVSSTVINFDFSAVGGYSFTAQAMLDNGVHTVAPSLQLVGTGNASITVSGAWNLPDSTYFGNNLFGAIVGTVPFLSVPYTIDTFSQYTVPNLQGPTLDPIQLVIQSQDSLVFNEPSILVGNAGPVTAKGILHDSLANTNVTTFRTIYNDTTNISFDYNFLRTNDGYTFTLIVFDAAGRDTQILVTRTLPINTPSLSATVDTSNLTQTSITITPTGYSNGTWNGSLSVISIVYPDQNGVSHTQTGLPFTRTQNPSFNLTNLSSGPAQNSAWIYIKDSLGFEDSVFFPFVLISPPPPITENAPTWGNLIMINASTLEADNVGITVSQDDTAKVGYVVEDITAGGTDTLWTSGGYTSTQTLPSFQMTGLIGGHTYQITPFIVSKNNIYTFGTWLQQYTDAPSNPLIEDIIISDTTNTSATITVRANGQGTPSQISSVNVFDNTTNALVDSYGPIVFGTGYVNYNFYPTNLDPGTCYRVEATVEDDQGDNPMERPQTFTTTGVLAIANVTKNAIKVYPNPTTDFIYGDLPENIQATINIFDLVGNIVSMQNAHGSFAVNLQDQSAGTYVLQILDENKKVLSTNEIVRK